MKGQKKNKITARKCKPSCRCGRHKGRSRASVAKRNRGRRCG